MVDWVMVMAVKKIGVLVTDRWTNGRIDIGGCRVTFATENSEAGIDTITGFYIQ